MANGIDIQFCKFFNVELSMLIKYSCKICHKEKWQDLRRDVEGYPTYSS